MSSLLEDLFYGDLVGQRLTYTQDSRYAVLSNQLVEKETALLVHLGEAEKDLYDELTHAYLSLMDCSDLFHFKRGFHMAAAFFRELSQDNSNLDG